MNTGRGAEFEGAVIAAFHLLITRTYVTCCVSQIIDDLFACDSCCVIHKSPAPSSPFYKPFFPHKADTLFYPS